MIYGVISAKQGGEIYLDRGVKTEDVKDADGKVVAKGGQPVQDGPYNVAPPVKVVKGEWNADPAKSYVEAHQNDLVVGLPVALHGLPSGTLHTVRILEPVGEKGAKATSKSKAAKKTKAELEAMTVEELHEHARKEGINLHGAHTKDDIVKAIQKDK